MMQFLGRCSRNWVGVFVIISVVAVFSMPAMAQVVPWYHVYDSTYGHDAGNGIAIDSQQNVVVAGYRRTSDSAEYLNAYAVKYNSLGNSICEITVSGPTGGNAVNDGFYGVAVDSQDNIIAVGTISGDYNSSSYYNAMYLNKYDMDCDAVWSQPVIYQYNSGSAWQEAYSVTLDVNDNIYATGRIFEWGNQGMWGTWKYNSTSVLQPGFPLLYNHLSDYTYQDYSYDVAIDSIGNIIVVGARGQASGNFDWHIRKYNASGTLIWSDTYSGNSNLDDRAYRVVVDSQDNPIVAGFTNKGTDNGTNANYDWLVIKYASDGVGGAGQHLWTYVYESDIGMSEATHSIAIDEHNNIIVGGYKRINSTTTHTRLAVLEGTTGNLIGERIVSDPVNVIPLRLAYRSGALAIAGYINDPANNNMYVALTEIDVVPDSFTLTDQIDVALNAVFESNEITVTGISADSVISISGGEYTIDSGTYTSTAGTVNNGDRVKVRLTSASSFGTTTNATLTIGGVSDTFSVTTVPALAPLSPANGTTFDTCSYFSPPAFGWARNQAFEKLELQFFTPANPTKPTKIKLKDPAARGFPMIDKTWKKILKLPGLSGQVNWKLVGTNKGQPIVETNVFTMTIAALEPVGKPDIDPVTHTATWGNSCGTKFKAYFSADSAFSKSKKLSFKYQGSDNPDDLFSVTFPDKTWASLEKLVEGIIPPRIYFYVESWDIIKRYEKTGVAYIDLDI